MIDAKQRAIVANAVAVGVKAIDNKVYFDRQLRICSEAAPDVFSAYATSAAAKIAARAAEKTGEGQLSLAVVENAATIGRTQTALTLRELMFRTCERFLNDGIDRHELIVQAARDQRVIVSILAIEQLTGVYTPAVIALSNTAAASTGGPSAETLKLVADAKTAADAAAGAAKKADGEAAAAEADANANGLNGKENCAAVLNDVELDAAAKEKCLTARSKRADHASLVLKAAAASDHYAQIKKLADQLGGTASAAGGGVQFGSGQSQAILTQNIEKVAGAVERIVQSTFAFDEARMVCIVALRKTPTTEDEKQLFNRCLTVFDAVIEADTAAANRIAIATSMEEGDDQSAILKCAFPTIGASRLAALVEEAREASSGDQLASTFRQISQKTTREELRDYLADEDPTLIALLALAANKMCS